MGLFNLQVFLGIASFFTISLLGMLIGIVYGVLTAFITKYTEKVRGKIRNSFPLFLYT